MIGGIRRKLSLYNVIYIYTYLPPDTTMEDLVKLIFTFYNTHLIFNTTEDRMSKRG